MRRRLNTAAVLGDDAASQARPTTPQRGRSSRNSAFCGVQKRKNPAVGTPGQIFLLSEFTVSSMRPGCCSLRPRARSGLLLLSSQLSVLVLLLSCFSLTVRNLTEPFANSHRFLSVAHSLVPGWGRPILSKTHAEGLKGQPKQLHMRVSAATDSAFTREPVKAADSGVSSAYSRFAGVTRRNHLFRMAAQNCVAADELHANRRLARKVA